jgi:SEC-C motif-containing protein
MNAGPLALQGEQPCPCARPGADKKPLCFSACCGQYLESDTPAPDAHSLMRSRYSAFVLQREAYLRGTWHTSTRPEQVGFDSTGKWLGLEVRKPIVSTPTEAESEAEVEFIARFKPVGARAWRLHERSRFVLQEGCWWYVDGVQLP